MGGPEPSLHRESTDSLMLPILSPNLIFSHSPIAARPRTGEGHVWPVSRVSVEEEATRIVSKGHEDL